MIISEERIEAHNSEHINQHRQDFSFLSSKLNSAEKMVRQIMAFQIAIPSWALGTGGTRFGRFPIGGEPRSLEEKIEDADLLNTLSRSCNAISLHIPWDSPKNPAAIKDYAASFGLRFDAMNSNTFQDQPTQELSYKFGSLQHPDKAVRKLAIEHNIEVIRQGIALGSKSLTVWLADGSSFPGQLNFRKSFQNVLQGLSEIYGALPNNWKMLIEYKAFEPNFYSTTVGDWGQSLLFASKLGPKAFTLVDLGHHLPNANIEQIVAMLLMEGKLGGFHFNDSKYGDDDLTAGSIKPYQLFLIFKELVEGLDAIKMDHSSSLAWMIDSSQNVKDPLEDLLQSIEAILLSYTQALLIDQQELAAAQEKNDVVQAQEILQSAFRTDVRPLVAEARLRAGGALSPIRFFRSENFRQTLIQKRGKKSLATGL